MTKILIIDDSLPLLRMVRYTLIRAGYLVKIARNGREGMWVFDRWCPDLVITDIVMPDMEGIECIRGMRRKCADVGIIAMSGGGLLGTSSAQIYLETASDFGADTTLTKPLTSTTLMAAIEAVLNKVAERRGPD